MQENKFNVDGVARILYYFVAVELASMNEISSLIFMQFPDSSILLSTLNQLHLLKPFQQCNFYIW